MINPGKIFQLEPGQKRRKLALTFGELERDILGVAEKGMQYDFPGMTRREYIRRMVEIVVLDPKIPESRSAELKKLCGQENFDERRVCNLARNFLLSAIGTFPAEWDLIVAPHAEEKISVERRQFFSGIFVYAEDIRSPFNVGSIFRTAEAMGCEGVFISPDCTSPEQPKARRSAMGCIETLGYSRISLDEIPREKNVFVLETGGIPLNEFKFPREGIVIVGSEELGASPQALNRATCGIVTIPMTGLKASLNVGVAFGILMQAWTEFLQKNPH